METSDESVKHNTSAGTIPPYSAAAQKTILQTNLEPQNSTRVLKSAKETARKPPKVPGWLVECRSVMDNNKAGSNPLQPLSSPNNLPTPPNTLNTPLAKIFALCPMLQSVKNSAARRCTRLWRASQRNANSRALHERLKVNLLSDLSFCLSLPNQIFFLRTLSEKKRVCISNNTQV